MKIGILGAGNIGRTLKAMLASVEGVSRATVADVTGSAEVRVDAATGDGLGTFVAGHDAVVNALPFYGSPSRRIQLTDQPLPSVTSMRGKAAPSGPTWSNVITTAPSPATAAIRAAKSIAALGSGE